MCIFFGICAQTLVHVPERGDLVPRIWESKVILTLPRVWCHLIRLFQLLCVMTPWWDHLRLLLRLGIQSDADCEHSSTLAGIWSTSVWGTTACLSSLSCYNNVRYHSFPLRCQSLPKCLTCSDGIHILWNGNVELIFAFSSGLSACHSN